MVQNDSGISQNLAPAADATPKCEPARVSLRLATDLISRTYPERVGMVRRIHPVFGNYFRVNFHNCSDANQVAASYFLEVTPTRVTEMN